MTLSEIMSPLTVFFEWMRNRTFYLGEYPFTFWDFFLWTLLASIVIGFIVKLRNQFGRPNGKEVFMITNLTNIQMICGTVFWCVAFVGLFITICVFRYLKLKYQYMANRFCLVDDEHRAQINKLCIRVTKLENAMIKERE